MNEDIKKQLVKKLFNLIKFDMEHNLFSKDFAFALEKEHRRIVRKEVNYYD